MGRELREVVYVDGVRTAFGRAGPKGVFWRTRADDLGVKVVRELLRRNPELAPERIDDVVMAATAQVGDQGLTLGRDVALLAGLPQSVPGFAVDRMCAGALTAVTAGAGEIAMGSANVVLAGGIEHMGHHPMGEDVDFNPRFVAERLVDPSAVTMGATAENLHDRFPQLTKRDADELAVRSQHRAAAAWENGVMRETVVPMSVFTDDGWQVAGRDEFLRPDTTMNALANLRPPFRVGGRVTAGNSAGLTDGATASLLAAADAAESLGTTVSFITPFAQAAAARCCDCKANASARSFVIAGKRSCRFSAVWPIEAADSSINRSETKRGLKSTSSPIGWWPMCSMPPASAMSAAPSAISPAAAVTAVSAPAHMRSTAKPGTVCGIPARSATSRPSVSPWSPTCAVAARTTSPIRSGGISGFRRSSSRTALTPMSSARVRQNCPFGPALPKGVRTPSTKRTSRACGMRCTIRR